MTLEELIAEQNLTIKRLEQKFDTISNLLLELLEQEEPEPVKDFEGNEIPKDRDKHTSLDSEPTDGGLG